METVLRKLKNIYREKEHPMTYFRFSEILRILGWWLYTDVLGQPKVPFSRVNLEDGTRALLRNVSNYQSTLRTHRRRVKNSTPKR